MKKVSIGTNGLSKKKCNFVIFLLILDLKKAGRVYNVHVQGLTLDDIAILQDRLQPPRH